MKKIILTGTALLAFAVTSFAQYNQGTLSQTGNQQTGLIDQVGSFHQATIDQTQGSSTNQGSLGFINQGSAANPGATANIGTINQKDGSRSNRAGIDQNVRPSSGTGSNTATINQKGFGSNVSGGNGTQVLPVSGNLGGGAISGVTSQGGNWGGITQEGNGTNTNSTIDQNAGSRGGSSANFANVYQNGTGSGAKTAKVSQSDNSTGNTAILYQGSTNGGLSNAVSGASGTIEQNGGALGSSTNNRAEMYQTNGVQTALIQQNNSSERNQATVTQSSPDNNNQATIRQSDLSTDNIATVNQTAGSGRTATIDQIDQSYHNSATIQQQGRAGFQASDAYVTQTQGSYNQAMINQNSYGSSLAKINQHNGNYNTAKITQNTTYYDFGGSNVAEIEQTGGTTSGTGNSATVDQDYSANTTKLKQNGTNNTATVKQLVGDLNVVKGIGSDVALQDGANNTLTITQTSSTLGTPFGNYVPNTANVRQVGTGNTGTITQGGMN